MKTTKYFDATCTRSDRVHLKEEWIIRAVERPEYEQVQEDGRVRRWVRIPEAGNKYLRVILLPDRETVHNAFFDRGFRP